MTPFYLNSNGNWIVGTTIVPTGICILQVVQTTGYVTVLIPGSSRDFIAEGLYSSFSDVTGTAYSSLNAFLSATSGFFSNGLSIQSYPTTQTLFIDGNRTDSYTPDGTIVKPFKTFSTAVAAMTSTTGYCLFVAPATYTETGSVTFPNVPINIHGNGAYLTCSGTVTIQNPNYIRRDLFTTANVVFNNFSAGARCVIYGGGITGNVTINSYLEMSNCKLDGGVVTVGSTGQLLVSSCSPTSTFVSTGNLLIKSINLNTNYSGGYLVSSTAGSLQISDAIIVNLNASNQAISCNNGATIAPNSIVDVNCGASGIISTGTAYTAISKFIGVISGTHILGASDVIGVSLVSIGSDATGDLYYRNSSGLLTRLPIGTTGQTLKVVGGLPAWQ